MLGQNERYIKQAIVDKHDLVASAALVAGLHLFKVRHCCQCTVPCSRFLTMIILQENTEIVRHWVSEVQSAVQAKRHMVQFHALALLRRIKQHDRLAVSKVRYAAVRYGTCNLTARLSRSACDSTYSRERHLPFGAMFAHPLHLCSATRGHVGYKCSGCLRIPRGLP